MAQDDATGSTEPEFFDNAVLDQFEIPFGSWMDQAVDWIDNNLDERFEIDDVSLRLDLAFPDDTSDDDWRLHFGLGEAELRELRVRWPDGATESFGAPRANRFLVLEQGAGKARPSFARSFGRVSCPDDGL